MSIYSYFKSNKEAWIRMEPNLIETLGPNLIETLGPDLY
jgi:hypothetical protein